MPARVVDASALVAYAFDEAPASAVERAFRGHLLHAPTLLTYEVANVALVKARRDPGSGAPLTEALHIALSLPFTLHVMDAESLLALAFETGLTVYDAAYLLLAMQLDAPLVTLDRGLAAAAQALGLLAR